jgi:hypothetical protein
MPKQSNNLLGDLSADGKARRDPIEDAIASLYRCLMDIDELALRLDQAVRRSSLVGPVLHPAQERLAQVRVRIATLHGSMSAYWASGQVRRWK